MKKYGMVIGCIVACLIFIISCTSTTPKKTDDPAMVKNQNSAGSSELSIDLASLDGTLWVFETEQNGFPFFHCISIKGDTADFYVKMGKETDGHEKGVISIEGDRIKFTKKSGGVDTGTFDGKNLLLNNEKVFIKQ